MSLIKLLLLSGVAAFGVLALRGGNSAMHRAFWRIAGLFVMLASGLSVLFPDTLTTIAQIVGVSRGADLLLYLLAVAFMVTVAILFRRISELEQRYIALLRKIAIDEAWRSGAGDQKRRPE